MNFPERGMKKARKTRDWLWGWSLMGEALLWEFLLNRAGEGGVRDLMIARSFRTAVAGAELLVGGTLFSHWQEGSVK
jgi:hypothetical protein